MASSSSSLLEVPIDSSTVNQIILEKSNSTQMFPSIQIRLLLTRHWSIELSWKEAISLFTVTQLVIQHQTSPGQKMAARQCCIMARRTAFLTYRDRLLEITHVQLGMEWVKGRMLLLQLLYTVSCILCNVFCISSYWGL